MFRPVKLCRVTIQVPEEYMSKALEVLGDLRLLHLININETQMGRLGYVAAVNVELVRRYDRAIERLNSIIRELGITSEPPSPPATPDPEQEIFHIEKRIEAIKTLTSQVIKEEQVSSEELIKREGLIKRLRLLEPGRLDFTRLSRLRYVIYGFGLLPSKNLMRLEESLSDIHHALVELGQDKGRRVIAAFCLKEDRDVLERALKSAFWEELSLPPGLQGDVSRIIADLEKSIPELKKRQEEALERKRQFAEQFGSELLELREKAFIARMLLKAQQKFGKIDHTYFLTGWLPVHLYDTLKDRLMAATKGKAIIDRVDPEEVREVREGIVKIPILFNNPMLIRPFERLTMLYGTPSYQEVEPTVFLAVSFILLFGMMFGDVGHGLVLFLAGLYIFRRIYRFMDYGIILMECGVSSAIFGLLYGSIFGIEDLIPALWLHPMRDIESFMKVSGLIGVGMISLGLILNLVNIFKRKSWHELAGSSGLAGALLYWLLAGLGIRYMVAGEPLSWEIAAAKTAGALLLGIIILHRPVLAWLKRKRAEKEGEQQPLPAGPGIGALLLESTIEALDGVLRFLANTVSFVRVAAFALTHAALFIGVFSIADMVAQGSGKGLSYYLTIVLGNIVIIVLEAMVVSIQTIRLEYYEFFSKFFRGGGQPFKPVVEEMKEAAK